MADLKYATAMHPTIAAVINQKYFFSTEQKALERLAMLRSQFVFSREGYEGELQSSVIWIRGFALSDDETERGYMGNFAHITVEQRNEGFTLAATKVERPITNHPQKKRMVASKHPNWGHPFLRRVKKGGPKVTYDTEEEAQADLDRFHKEYPETSIPGVGRMYAHVWVAEGGDIGGGHIQKIIIDIKQDIDSKYVIIWRPNYKAVKEIQNPETAPTKVEVDRSDVISSSIDGMFD